jgi:hypothetical protein
MKATAAPFSKKNWKNKKEALDRSLYGKTRFVHTLCAYWCENVTVDADGVADASNVIKADGRTFVLPDNRCGLCGVKQGLKAKCKCSACRGYGEKKSPYMFHVTCARQAGLEVAQDDQPHPDFYGKFESLQQVNPRSAIDSQLHVYLHTLSTLLHSLQ